MVSKHVLLSTMRLGLFTVFILSVIVACVKHKIGKDSNYTELKVNRKYGQAKAKLGQERTHSLALRVPVAGRARVHFQLPHVAKEGLERREVTSHRVSCRLKRPLGSSRPCVIRD